MHRQAPIGTIVLLLGACASAGSPSSSSVIRSWDYAAEPAAVRIAAARSLREVGFEPSEEAAESDELRTAWRSFAGATGYSTCSGEVEGRATLRIGEGTSGTRVTMEIEFRRPDPGAPKPCASTGEMERRLNRLILEELRA